MIRKCCQNIVKAVIPSLPFQSGAVIHHSQQFTQQKVIICAKGANLEDASSLKASTLTTNGLKSPTFEPVEISETSEEVIMNGRIHGFKGEERVYFFLIAGLLLGFNVAARLAINNQQRHDSYKKAQI